VRVATSFLVLLAVAAADSGAGAPSLVRQLNREVAPPDGCPGTSRRPSVVLQTDRIVVGSPIGVASPEVRLSFDPNGWEEPVTLFLYHQVPASGERRYYSAADGWLEAGVVADLLGSESLPMPLRLPKVDDLVLFGEGSAFGPAPDRPSGQYLFGIELREASGRQAVARAWAPYTRVDRMVEIVDDIVADARWQADAAHRLTREIRVAGGATLTIDPGTVVFSELPDVGGLVVEPGAALHAEGTPLRPIVFTADPIARQAGPGEWRGVTLRGHAPVAADPDGFGGADPDDTSGILRFVRIEYAGIAVGLDESSALTLEGVGRGTSVDHVQVHASSGDGVSIVGGTVELSHILATDTGDDSLDWERGWTGRVQFLVSIQRGPTAGSGIEGDGWRDDHDAMPRSSPTVANATLVGNGASPGASVSGEGVLLRRGTAGHLVNLVVTGFGRSAVRVDDAATFDQVREGSLDVDHCVLWANELIEPGYSGHPGDADAVRDLLWNGTKNRAENPLLTDPYGLVPDLRPGAGSPARDLSTVGLLADNRFFTPVEVVGGLPLGDHWTDAPWTHTAAR